MFAESSASDLFRKFTGNETKCSTNQMARKPLNVNKKISIYILHKLSICRPNGSKVLILALENEFSEILFIFNLAGGKIFSQKYLALKLS